MSKASLIFRIQRWIYFLLKGVGKREKEHYLFTLNEPLSDFELYQRLADAGWTPNYMGFAYKGQQFQARKLLNRGREQLHVRFYDDCRVTGHKEVSPEFSERLHLHPEPGDLRTMNEEEKLELWSILEQK